MKKSLGPKTIVHPAPVFVIGTYDRHERPNAMTAAWAGICCSSPPCIGVSLRKATYTFGNIMDRKAFTVNIPSRTYPKEADYFGMVSGREVDKFSMTGLTPIKSELIDAPYVRKFPFFLECRLFRTFEIGLHTQFIGEILDVKADASVLGEDGLSDMEKIMPLLYAPENRAYYNTVGYMGRAFFLGKEIGKPAGKAL